MPNSPLGAGFPLGCSGALEPDRESSEKICAGNLGEYSWWRDCCEWDESKPDGQKCVPKGKRIFTLTLPTKGFLMYSYAN